MTLTPTHLKQHMRILRKKFGADTPIGHRCSNVEGAIFNLQHAIVPGPTGEFQRANLEKAIKRGLTEIAQLAAQS